VVKTGIIDDDDIAWVQLRTRHFSNHISNKSRLHEPVKVIGANNFPCLRAAIQLTRSVRVFLFESIEALPNLTVAIRVVLSVINARFIDIDNLTRSYLSSICLGIHGA
jgi:hypothetical protein